MQKTCIVVPCYNEEKRLDSNEFVLFVESNSNVDFLFVNDGSNDDTISVLKKIQEGKEGRIIIHDLEKNSGKAEAVRLGILKALSFERYDFVGFFDADLATPLSEIIYFLQNKHDAKIVMGSRMKRLGVKVERKVTRHILGRVFSTLASIILKLPVYDTQCGAKIFDKDLFFLFEEKFITKWLFDIELIARFRNKFGVDFSVSNIIEMPVNKWVEKGGSKLKIKHMLSVPFELINIYRKYN